MSVKILNLTETDGRQPIVLFDNLLVGSSVTPSNADVTLDETTITAFQWSDNQTITFDLGSTRDFSAFNIVGCNFVGDVTLSFSGDNFTYTDITPTGVEVSKEDCVLFLFNTRSARYFRVEFQGSGNFSIRCSLLGTPLEFQGGVGVGYVPIWLAVDKELLLSQTLNGQFIGNRVISKGAMTDIPMVPESRSFVENELQPFIAHYNDGKPFVWASGPTVFNKDCAYVWRQDGSGIRPSFLETGNWMVFDLAVEGYVNQRNL